MMEEIYKNIEIRRVKEFVVYVPQKQVFKNISSFFFCRFLVSLVDDSSEYSFEINISTSKEQTL